MPLRKHTSSSSTLSSSSPCSPHYVEASTRIYRVYVIHLRGQQRLIRQMLWTRLLRRCRRIHNLSSISSISSIHIHRVHDRSVDLPSEDLQRVLHVGRLHARATDLAARCLGDGPRNQQQHLVRTESAVGRDGAADATHNVLQLRLRILSGTDLRGDDQLLLVLNHHLRVILSEPRLRTLPPSPASPPERCRSPARCPAGSGCVRGR